MPCKPAEYDYGRKDGEGAEARVIAAVEQRERLLELLLAYATAPDLVLPVSLQRQLETLAGEDPEPLPPRPEAAVENRYRHPREGSWALGLLFRADREERWLCRARSILHSVVAYRPPPPALRASFEAQHAAHRRHREEDLANVRQALRAQIERLEAHPDAWERELDDLRRRLAEAERLTVDDILAHSDRYEALWP